MSILDMSTFQHLKVNQFKAKNFDLWNQSTEVSLWTTLFLKWMCFNKLFCLSKLSLLSWVWFREKFMKWSWEWCCIFTLHQQGAPRVLTYNERGLCCERIHNPDSSEAEQTVRAGVRSMFSIVLVLYFGQSWELGWGMCLLLYSV